MTPFAWAALAAYAAIFIFESLLALLNARHLARLGGSVPAGLEGAVDGALLGRARAYGAGRARLGLARAAAEALATALFVFAGPLDLLDAWVLSLGLGFVPAGLLFLLVPAAASLLLGLPFSLYGTFVLEARFGFTTTTPRRWLADLALSLLVSTAIGAAAASASLALVRASPSLWWLWVWLFMLLFGVVLMYASPLVIEPLFNRYEPLRDAQLEAKVRELMGRAGIGVSRVLVVDASRRTRHSNAYFTGIGRTKRIVLYDTLLEGMGHDEILAVLAHEAGHWKKRHVLTSFAAVECAALAGLFVASRLLEGGHMARALGLAQGSFYAQALLVGFAGSIVLFPLTPVVSLLSRARERQADRFACAAVGGGVALSSALVKLHRDNLANLHPHPLYAAFYYTHPPLVQRLKTLRG